MLLHDRFIENHLRYAHRDKVLCGYRGVKLGQEISRALISGERKFNQSPILLVWETLRHRVREGTRGFVIHNRILRSIIARRPSRLPGCNFSTHRENLYKVNGMDESILIYGFEDLELGHRLQLIGVQITDVSRCCNTYHLHHHKKQSGDISDIKKNISNSNAKQCKNGLEKLESGSNIEDFMPSGS
jgi:GT2 family glycosyltransferase